MLYGFRSELGAEEIANEGYNFTIYGLMAMIGLVYFMRKIAERPQNLSPHKRICEACWIKTCWHNCSFIGTVMLGLLIIKIML